MNENIEDIDNWVNTFDENNLQIIDNLTNTDSDKEETVENDDSPLPEHEKVFYDNYNGTIKNDMKCICIDDILKKNKVSLLSYELLQCECSISHFVQVLLEDMEKMPEKNITMEKITSIIEYLEWISDTCGILAKRISQKLLFHEKYDIPKIIRSSYNFCMKNTQCKNFYVKNASPDCKDHHYVHSLLKYDVDSILLFLKYIVKNNIKLTSEHLSDLNLSIKTICFVTRHMAKEINYINHITKNNSEQFHKNNPFESGKKTGPRNFKYNKSRPTKSFSNKSSPKNNNFKNNNRYSILSNF